MSIKRRLFALIVAAGLLGGIPAAAAAAGSSYWNVAGTYGVNVEYLDSRNPRGVDAAFELAEEFGRLHRKHA